MLLALALVLIVYESPSQQLPTYQTITLVYADGNEETLGSSENVVLSIVGAQGKTLTLFNPSGSRIVLRIIVRLFVTANYDGAISDYTISGYAEGHLINALTKMKVATIWSSPFGITGSYLPSGSSTRVSSSSVDASTLEGLYSGWEDYRTYYYDVLCPSPMTVMLTFSNGASQSLTTTPATSRVTFMYRSV